MDLSLSWVDLALATLLLISVGVGLWRGLVFEVMSLAGWVVAYLAASPLAPLAQSLLPQRWVEALGPTSLHLVSLFISFMAVLLIWGLASRLIKMLIQASPLSALDRLGGAAFGTLRGVLVALLLVLVIGASPIAQSATWQASRAVPVLTGALQTLAPLFPEPVANFITRSMEPSDAASTE